MANTKTVADVKFRPKSQWQKDDCINGCGRESSLEAILPHSAVRCCMDEGCKKAAAEIAVAGENAFTA